MFHGVFRRRPLEEPAKVLKTARNGFKELGGHPEEMRSIALKRDRLVRSC